MNQNKFKEDNVQSSEGSLSHPAPIFTQVRRIFMSTLGLRAKVMLAILIPIAIVLVISTFVEFTRNRERDLANMSLIAAQTGQVIEYALQRDMLFSDFERIQATFDTIGQDESIRTLYLLDTSGRIVFAPNGEGVGEILNNKSETCQPCHNLPSAERPSGIVSRDADGQSYFRSMVPIENLPECHQCHDPASRLNGLILTDFSIAPVESAVAAELRENLIWLSGTALLTVLAASVVINRLVISRLQRLAAAMTALRKDQLPDDLPESPSDEIGRLSAIYNAMVQRLRKRDLENKDLTEALQKRISERERLFRRLIDGQEQERIRVSRELHDDLGQQLSAIALRLDLAQRALPDDADAALESLTQVDGMISDATDRMYDVIMGLRPSILDDLGLIPALKNLCERTLKPPHIAYELALENLPKRLPKEIETALFRIFQEALTNIVRHAEASSVQINLEEKDGLVKGMISDDGQGLDKIVTQRLSEDGSGFGILGMRERAELCGGEFSIDSQTGMGTIITIRIPIKGQADE
jgi:signal transduction histidine kinase